MSDQPPGEITPQKSETLAKKFAEKSERRRLLVNIRYLPAKSLVRAGEILFLAAIYFINLWLLAPFFGRENATAIFSAPLVPILSLATSIVVPYEYGVRIWLLVFMLGLPIAFYFFVREISRRRLPAMIATLLVSMPIGNFLYLRVMLGLLGSDGGQIATLTIMVLVCMTLFRFLRLGNFSSAVLTSIGVALIALISPFGFIIMLIFSLTLTFSEMLLGQARLKFIRLLTIVILSAGFAAFWYNPNFLLQTLSSEQGKVFVQGTLRLIPVSFFLLPLMGTFGFLLFENRPQYQSLFLGIFLTIFFGLLSLGTGTQVSAPSRFLPGFGIALSLLLSVVFAKIYDNLKYILKMKKIMVIYRFRKIIPGIVIVITLISLLVFIEISGRDFREIEELTLSDFATYSSLKVLDFNSRFTSIGSFIGWLISICTVVLVVKLRSKIKET